MNFLIIFAAALKIFLVLITVGVLFVLTMAFSIVVFCVIAYLHSWRRRARIEKRYRNIPYLKGS